MKFALIVLSLISFSVLAEVSPVQTKIEAEVVKDLAGEKSCFNGAVKAKMTEMEENYGGRFGGSYDVSSQTVFETVYRYTTKYCSDFLDINLNIIERSDENEDKIVYRRCENANLNKSVASITFAASTSGTFEREGLVFGVELITNNDIIVDKNADYQAEDSEIKSWKVTETLTCKLLEL